MSNLVLLGPLALLVGPAVAGPLAAGGSARFELSSGAGQPFREYAPIDGQGMFSHRSDVPFGDSGPDGFSVTSLTFGGNVDPNLTYSVAVVDIGAGLAASLRRHARR